jgi:hypothetical protein
VTWELRGPANAEELAALETDVLAGFAGLERDTDSFGILPTRSRSSRRLGEGGAAVRSARGTPPP